jgi:DNA-binding NarL/FixJ family response regulator
VSRTRAEREPIAEVIPERWRAFVRSGDYAGARAFVEADGARVPVDVAARVEFLDERRLAIHVTLGENDRPVEHSPDTGPERPLTRREREVVALIAAGYETAGIAENLVISHDTVRTHVRNAMSKLKAHTRAQLVAIVASAGVILPRSGEQ